MIKSVRYKTWVSIRSSVSDFTGESVNYDTVTQVVKGSMREPIRLSVWMGVLRPIHNSLREDYD